MASVHAKSDDDVAAPTPVLDTAGQVGPPVVSAVAAVEAEMPRLPILATVCGRLLAAVVISVPAGEERPLRACRPVDRRLRVAVCAA